MPERVLPHKHCPECGTAIGVKDEFCSKDCQAQNKERVRAKKRQMLWLYAGGVAMFAIAMLLLVGGL